MFLEKDKMFKNALVGKMLNNVLNGKKRLFRQQDFILT